MDKTVLGKVNISVDITEKLASDILMTAFDSHYGSSNYWASLVSIDNNGASDILDEIWYSVKFTEPDEPDTNYVVDGNKIVSAISKILNNEVEAAPYIVEYLQQAVANDDAGYADGDVADVIVQVASMGEIVYG